MIMMSQRRRPTASARRQRQEARIVEDPRTIVEELNEEQQQPHVEGVIDVEGEATITLDDVALLLHLLIIGAFHSFEQLHVDDVVYMLVELLKVSIVEARAETIQCHGSYVRLSSIEDYDQQRPRACRWTSSKALPVSTYHRRLNRLTPDVVCWISYGDHHSFREFEPGDPLRVSPIRQYDIFVEPDVH
ncbi:hypothetical protein GmHk_06G016677 [Glycine max]|nr:hypothetical protein GmHk_06G016677 [Glycine max]